MVSFNFGHSETKIDNSESLTKNYSVVIQQKSFKESQLIGNWYFLSRDNDSNSKTENLVEGKSIIIETDYQYESDVFDNKESGSWSFNEKTQVLTLKTETTNDKWKLKNINDSGMVLINIETNEKWIFAAE